MKIAIIGRTAWLYDTMVLLSEIGHDIKVIVTARAVPEYKKTEKDFEEFASKHSIPFYVSNKLDSQDIMSRLEGLDVGISVNWVSMVQDKHINQFRLGVLNAHLGDLPRYRGNACPNWAIIQGEKEIVLSIHFMEGGSLDSGFVIVQDRYKVKDDTYIGDVYRWAGGAIPKAFVDALDILGESPDYHLKYADANSSESFRCYPRKPEDSRIDWNQSAEHIHRIIRASSEPLPGAYSFYRGDKMIVWRASVVSYYGKYLAISGQIADIRADGSVDVVTGSGVFRITDAEYHGLRCYPSSFIKSIRSRLE